MAGEFVAGQSDADEQQNNDPVVTLTGVTAGNFLLVALSYGASRTIDSVISSNGGALTLAVESEAHVWNRCGLWFLENSNSGTHTVTVAMSGGGSFCRAVLLEYTGLETTSVLSDASGSNEAGNNTSVNSGDVTTAENCLFIANGTHSDVTQGLNHDLTGQVERLEDTNADFMPYSVMESPGLASGTYSNNFSRDGGGNVKMGTVLAAFKEAAAPAAGGMAWPSPTKQMAHLLNR
jgi:hypothetical protein